jgi:Tol biopolymer transport system component
LNIWRIHADGTGLTPITTAAVAGADSSSPQWSPDGTQIIFASLLNLDESNTPNVSSTANVWRINADGSKGAPLTRATASGDTSPHVLFPGWSPDGTWIIFTSARKLDGSDAANATNSPGPPGPTTNVWRIALDGGDLLPLTRTTASGAGSLSSCSSGSGTELSLLALAVAMAWMRRRSGAKGPRLPPGHSTRVGMRDPA